MKVDNFVLLIISTATLIIISLVTECNKGRLKELENKATNDIVESFYHMGSATPTEAGEWGYKITSITHGKYGGRSSQDVLSNLGSHNVNNYITEDELISYENTIGQDRINIENQQWRHDIVTTDCDWELNDTCLWVDPDNIGSDISKYTTDGIFAKTINIETIPHYGESCGYNEGDRVTNADINTINMQCNSNKINYSENDIELCNKYYVKDSIQPGFNNNSKVYAKKINYYEGIYGGQNVDDNVYGVFTAKDINNATIVNQDSPNSDGIITRFKQCTNSDIQNNPSVLNLSSSIQTNRNKSLKITFRRVWSNNGGDYSTNDNESNPINSGGMTKWKVEIDDGNWEGLQISDIDNLGFIFNGHQLSNLNNKYILVSTKNTLKTQLNTFMNTKIELIKNLLNIDDSKFNTIKDNLSTDNNASNFTNQNCEATTSQFANEGAGDPVCERKDCGNRPSKYKYRWQNRSVLNKVKDRLYNGNDCNDMSTSYHTFTSNEIKNRNQGHSLEKTNQWCDANFSGNCATH